MNDGAGGIYAEGNLAIALEQVEGSHLVERLPVGARLNVEVALATAQTIPPSDMNTGIRKTEHFAHLAEVDMALVCPQTNESL